MDAFSSDSDVDLTDTDVSWSPFFRYESAYADQYRGIERFLDVLKENGFYSLEGPCGTGKTLIAVTAALEAIRSDDYPDYERVGVFTPNKQQLKQFIQEMRGVNRSLPTEITKASTVVMKGRGDLMPYAFCDLPPFDRKSVSDHADSLREKTREIIMFGSDIPLDWPTDVDPPASAHHDYDWSKASPEAKARKEQNPYDPIRAEGVRKILISKQETDDDYEKFVVDGVESPYPDVVPHTNHIVSDSELEEKGLQQLLPNQQGKFDPFYASFFARGYPSFGFSDAEHHVLDRDTLFKFAVSEGVCPHETMAHYAEKADVVLGNYNHLFDPRTRLLTESKIGLFDEETILVLDEAHRIEGKVKKMLSTRLNIYTIDKAIRDLQLAQSYVKGEIKNTPTPDLDADHLRSAIELSKAALDEVNFDTVCEADIGRVEELLILLKQKLNELSADYLHEQYPRGWQAKVEQKGASEEEIPLTNVELPTADGLLIRRVISRFDDGPARMEKAYAVFTALDYLYDYLDEAGIYDREPQGVGVGKFCYDWVNRDIVEYHREIVLDPSQKDNVPTDYPAWVREWTPAFQLFNCIPTEPLKDIFSEVGGGILMSATLSPPEVFKEAVGVDEIPLFEDDASDSDNTKTTIRRSEFDQFPLRFPKENRLSIVADLPKYTSTNRGKITTAESEMTQIRRQYADMIDTIATSEGNVLICLPKYAEAKWAYEWMQGKTSKALYLDQSSTNEETNELLEQFFEADTDGVMFTSARGTITEGVDYDGSKLHCCAVIGIPMINTRSERVKATKYAYSKKIDSQDGFETAIKIPAVRKSRQAIGRVVRGTNEVGVRLLVDERYGSDEWDGAKKNLSEDEQEEFEVVAPDVVDDRISEFWSGVDREQAEKRAKEKSAGGESIDEGCIREESETVAAESAGEPVESKPTSTPNRKSPSEYTKPNEDALSKIYLGQGSTIKGWIPLPSEVIEEHIVPIILENKLDQDDEDGISINSTKDISISEWFNVKTSKVLVVSQSPLEFSSN